MTEKYEGGGGKDKEKAVSGTIMLNHGYMVSYGNHFGAPQVAN